jgi:flagellar assembly protein FliH
MIRRMDMTASSLLPWQFPELDAPSRFAPMPPPAADETEDVAAARSEMSAAAPADANGGGADASSIDAIVAAEIAKGYAEGLQRGLAEGREQGYAEGFAAGSHAAERSLAREARRLAALLERLREPMPALEKAIEEAVVSLALEIARCVIGSEISRSRASLVRLLRETLAQAPIEMGALEVVLNPADLDLVRALAPEIESEGTVLVGDAAVEAGGCIIIGRGEAKDVRWHPRLRDGVSQIDLTLAARWRNIMLRLFDDEEE